ncbi:Chaperone protein dnaJ 20, chloroplastic [Heracleum sosnowskyi]|uniref:Chaperone protein dnaJ 20, chloroplastic n=1 Tax=Heracleum sosnowskyi TaxID=360622 RepID=A0AAD8JJN3_9APIA|nr:Chaperone protein dnaJ 20, chloroplastic [Heracleum sosnowskyi]
MDVSFQPNNANLYMPKAMKSVSCKVSTKISCRVKANFYQVLSLSSEDNVGFDEIKKAYRSKALEFHPDVCPPSNRDESTRRFVEIRKAYDTLSDPDSRRMYDYQMSLVGSYGGGHCYEDKRGEFSKKVWERQLSGLKKRSLDKSEKKKNASA